MRTRLLVLATAILSAASLPLAAPRDAKIDAAINAKIRQEAEQHSQIMRTLHYLSDVYGPRLTGSPQQKAAAEWAVKQMTEWGFSNGHLEPWDFGHPGWVNEHLEMHIVSPVKDALVVEALAWTPGTSGRVTAPAVHLVPPEGPEAPSAEGRGPQHLGPTPAELTSYLDSMKAKVHGAAVLVGPHVFVPVDLEPRPGRMSDLDARCRFDPDAANDPACEGRRRGYRRGARAPQPEGRLSAREVSEQIDAFLVANGAAARIDDAGRPHGQIVAYNNVSYDVTKAVPEVVMRNEDYGRITRILADGTPVTLAFTITNKTYPEGRTTYNAIAEIPGTDKKNEVVMLGGHLDSWHSATGATDNAIGSAIMMEAARILKAIGVQPRRTIRVALWSGEEEGLLGSLEYVKTHFGSAEEPKPDFATLDAYLNIDSGTGRPRGATVFGPPEAAAILRETLAPFKDLGVVGAIATTSRQTGGTDSTSFNHAGLAGVGFGQDTIEYGSHTHHTNLDTYERVIESDVKAAATVIAATLYQLAMRDEMLPRFPPTEMPPPPQPRGSGR